MDYSINDSPAELVDQVCDKETFVRFLRALGKESAAADDLQGANPDAYRYSSVIGWENGSIGQYLDAAAAWLEDNWDKFEAEGRSEISWKLMADILYGGKIYE